MKKLVILLAVALIMACGGGEDLAEETGIPYQTLINLYFRYCAATLPGTVLTIG